MIVVIGTVSARADGPTYRASGYAATVAFALAAAGEPVELVSKIGVDAAGEALITQLAAARIGHVALIRDGALASMPCSSSTPSTIRLLPPRSMPAPMSAHGSS